jgi:hypothetical protein
VSSRALARLHTICLAPPTRLVGALDTASDTASEVG